jgi:hypothetical protein
VMTDQGAVPHVNQIPRNTVPPDPEPTPHPGPEPLPPDPLPPHPVPPCGQRQSRIPGSGPAAAVFCTSP